MSKRFFLFELRWLLTILGVLLFGLFLLVMTMTVGHVSGTEFAPSHFQLRDFEFYQIPLVRIQVSPVTRKARGSGTMLYLTANQLVTVPQTAPSEWHVVALGYGSGQSVQADASLLTDALESVSPTSQWEDWSKKHPNLARVLWPKVQGLAQRELYVFIPETLKLAARATDPQELDQAIDRYLSSEQTRLAQDLIESGMTEHARELVTEALREYPDDKSLREILGKLPSDG